MEMLPGVIGPRCRYKSALSIVTVGSGREHAEVLGLCSELSPAVDGTNGSQDQDRKATIAQSITEKLGKDGAHGSLVGRYAGYFYLMNRGT